MPSFDVPPRSLGELARSLGCELRGDAQAMITGVGSLTGATRSEIAFFADKKLKAELAACAAGAILCKPDAEELLDGKAALFCANPALAFAQLSAFFAPRLTARAGIDARAIVEPGARVASSAQVMACAYVAADAVIGEGALLFPFTYVGSGARIGEEAILYPGAVVMDRCIIGARAILHAGAVIGADGFGYAYDHSSQSHVKFPQVGTAELGPDVEVGANSAVDRAALDATLIGRGCKLDNLVQVGHNCEIGANSILCGQVGIAGSAKLGQGVVLGGQSGVAGHIQVADGVRIGAQSGVLSGIDQPGEYIGTPALPGREAFRIHIFTRRAAAKARAESELERRVEELERRLALLTAGDS